MFTRQTYDYFGVHRVLTWSTIDAVITQSLLVIYEYMIPYVMGADFHGLFGYAVSILYIAAGLTNFGFDSNLAAFSQSIQSSWKNCTKFLCGVWLPHIAWIIFVACYMYAYIIGDVMAGIPLIAQQAWICVFIIEAIRKTCKHILRYLGGIAYAASIEISGTIAYITFALVGLTSGVFTSLAALLCIHAITATIQILALCIYIVQSTRTMASDTSLNFSILQFHIHRIFVGINEVAGTLYTGNFLIPFVTYSRGYEFASIFRLAGNTARWFVMAIQQVFATTGGIILAHQKQRSVTERSYTFYQLTYYLHQVVYAGICFVLINSRWLFVPHGITTITPLKAISIGFFLFALNIVDSFCAFYLRWYIVEEQAYSIAIFNIISILGMDLIVRLQDLGDMTTIMSMFAMRTFAFIMISAWSMYIWNLRPPINWEKKSIMITLAVSVLFLLIQLWQYV